ncbi:cytochrome P450 [Melanogaster broomeanus]|nr:cytochrome P450 [Melanogaster broomeanus]
MALPGLDGVALIVCGVLAITLSLSRRRQLQKSRNASGLPYPPGPTPLPLLGNILHLNTAEPWLSYTEWSKTYGEILYVPLLGLDFIVLNSEKVARALLDQRSGIYSDRPSVPTYKMFGIDFSTVTLPYGDEWKLHRKLLHYSLRSHSASKYCDTYMRKTRDLLMNLLATPEQFERHLKTFVGSVILSVTYGHETSSTDDPLFSAVEQLMEILEKGLSPERAAILSAFPFLGHLPPWFPGTGLTRDAILSRKLASEVLNVPFDLIKENMVKGCASPSMVSECLSQIDENAEEQERQRVEHAIKSSAATLFIAGSETNSSLLHAFILAMVLYPEVQAKAHTEIDSVVGPSRLPDYNDRSSLPYLNNILLELLRWNPVVPLGMPHATSKSDIYNGFYIPQGAYIIVNVWAMSRDSDKYCDAEEFKPERHFADDVATAPSPTQDPVFGIGRRTFTSILAMFHITNAKDDDGHEIPVEKKFTSGISVWVFIVLSCHSKSLCKIKMCLSIDIPYRFPVLLFVVRRSENESSARV